MRTERRHSLSSLSTSSMAGRSWSFLSGISLAQISLISVVSLPLSAHELYNPEHYAVTLSNIAEPLPDKSSEIPDGMFPKSRTASFGKGWKGRSLPNVIQGKLLMPSTIQSLSQFSVPEVVELRYEADYKVLLLGRCIGRRTPVQFLKKDD